MSDGVEFALQSFRIGSGLGTLTTGDVFPVALVGEDPQQKVDSALIEIDVSDYVGPASNWWLRICVNGEAIHGTTLRDGARFLVRGVNQTAVLSAELKYLGKNRRIDRSSAVKCTAMVTGMASEIRGRSSRVLELV